MTNENQYQTSISKVFFTTGDHFVTFHNLFGLSRGVEKGEGEGPMAQEEI